ncbi:MAG: hypothetical protein KF912_11115 [Phycisphaeraceae bacterium]|nr:hypothetical protein [Phycisphaeraceae bacterium]
MLNGTSRTNSGHHRAYRHMVAAIALLLSLLSIHLTHAQPVASPEVSPTAIPASRQAKNVAIITIKGEIRSGITAESFKRRLAEAEASGADALVVELDTPGGEVGTVLEICDAIKASSIPNTVAWVRPNAYSGGAIIALACRTMVASDPATLGDALPIAINALGMLNQLPEHERQKILSPLMAEVVDSARRNGYDEYLVQGIVSRGVELWLVEDTQTGARFCIDRAEYAILFNDTPPTSRPRLVSAQATGNPQKMPSFPGPTPQSPTGTPDAASPTPQVPSSGPTSGPASGLASPDTSYRPASPALAAIAKEVSNPQTLGSRRPLFSESDRGRYTLVEYVSDGAGPVVMKHSDLVHLGFVDQTIKTDSQLKAYFGATNVERLNATWSEGIVFWMTNPVVRGFFIVVFLISLFIELTHPGVALPGAIAAVALVCLVGPPLMIGMASWWEVAAIIVGIGLVAIEIFVLPGFTVFGVIGLICLFGGLVGTFVRQEPGHLFPDSPGARDDLLYGVATILLSSLSAVVAMYFIGKHFGSLPIVSKLVLSNTSDTDELILAMDPTDGIGIRIGQTGRTLTPLRPAGRAMIGDRVVDVVSDLGFLESGTQVRVVEATPFRIAVALDDAPRGEGETV